MNIAAARSLDQTRCKACARFVLGSCGGAYWKGRQLEKSGLNQKFHLIYKDGAWECIDWREYEGRTSRR